MKRRELILGSLLLPIASTQLIAGQSDDGVKRLAIQVSAGDTTPLKQELHVAASVALRISNTGKIFETVCVDFNT